jgi:DNA-binding PadR family transcriptional regulator
MCATHLAASPGPDKELIMSDTRNPTTLTPLRPVEFDILLVLSGRDSHGYGIIKEVEERSEGTNRIATGTLYRALRRLTSARLVVATESREARGTDDERRRYYAITAFGREVAAAEARRLESQVATARARALLSDLEEEGGVG